jgi:chromosome segregation protein
MKLIKIKIAGFKSFVDPTVVHVRNNLVAIVGPNGCGKSNIIDAVCWVMGESSAKYLRGESLTDVIFNGSTSRKPVGQASVELIFDNQDGSLGGEYASYSEISIRRQINRDAESVFYLNGTRCRRRDIIGIFLGTGLGPRSYSIIGQNMISRIIDAKPEEVRIYLEEAAGISKYKERRRETENRIHHTKENLARLNDIRSELEKQLNSLKRQAQSAERFKTLKSQERLLRAQWLAAQWRQIDKQLVQYTLQMQQQETGLEARLADLSQVNLNIDKIRVDQQTGHEELQEIQRQFYGAGNEINRIEQEIRHNRQRQQQWQADIAAVNKDWEIAQETALETQDELTSLSDELIQLEPDLASAKNATKDAEFAFATIEKQMQRWQTQWDDFNQQFAKTTQTAQVEQTRISHLEQRLASIKQRQEKITLEQEQISFSALEEEIATLTIDLDDGVEKTTKQNNQMQQLRQRLADLQTTQQKDSQQLDSLRSNLQKARGQQASLEALQQTALGQRNNSTTQWLEKNNLNRKPRLAQGLEVAKGWELAAEKVLGQQLQAICVDDIGSVTDIITQLKQGSLAIFATQNNSSKSILTNSENLLLAKIKTTWPIETLLAGIYTAENLTDALALLSNLQADESVITRDGIWLGQNWLRVSHEHDPAVGIFQRENELKELTQQINELTERQAELDEKFTADRNSLKQLELERDTLQKAINQSHTEVAQLQGMQKAKQERCKELTQQMERYRKEQIESVAQFDSAAHELENSREAWQAALTQLETYNDQRENLIAQRDHLREEIISHREKVNHAKDQAHQYEIRLQTTQSQHGLLQQTDERLQKQIALLLERKNALENDPTAKASIAELEAALGTALSQRTVIETQLNARREKISTIENILRDLEKERQLFEADITKSRDSLQATKLEDRSLRVKNDNLLEQFAETSYELEAILLELPADASADLCQQHMDEISVKISRLGAINLIAIEEFASCSERKEYLDRQYNDLQEGLDTLENAIAKIDKETRARFKETFEKVNTRFQELFPMIFGGGKAYLELTGENLLDTGIAIMACPPGKRNSTIHLLSGGEKAMTAIALVFSIFHLNPAPFCLLDEVDAPLDDANIDRFCQLVKSMSDKTQFIFISHNKLAIEMGEDLLGVTMHEPGVSRLVSVNVEEAVSLAGL